MIVFSKRDRRGEEIKPIKSSEIKRSSRENGKEINNLDDVGTLLGIF